MIAADGQRVAVAGGNPHVEIGPGQIQTGGEGGGAAVDGMEAVGVEVIRESAGAADAETKTILLRGIPSLASTFFVWARME